jgi:hypothetical protein
MRYALRGFVLSSILASPMLCGIDNLKLNPHLDYNIDSLDGPLITGDDAQSGLVPGAPKLPDHLRGRMLQFKTTGTAYS